MWIENLANDYKYNQFSYFKLFIKQITTISINNSGFCSSLNIKHNCLAGNIRYCLPVLYYVTYFLKVKGLNALQTW